MDLRIELVHVPVSDVDRAKAFYVDALGFHADHDHDVAEGVRFVQLTPPGSACSIAIGSGINPMEPGTQLGLQVCVDDIEPLHERLLAAGVDVTAGIDDLPWGRFFFLRDPDGNAWTVQQKPVPAA